MSKHQPTILEIGQMELDGLRERIAALEAEKKELQTVIKLLLDHVDYTSGACGLTEMVGGALPYQIIARAKAALAAGK